MQLRSKSRATSERESSVEASTESTITVPKQDSNKKNKKRTGGARERQKLKKLKITGLPQQVSVGSDEEDLETGVAKRLFKALMNNSKDDLQAVLSLWKDLNSKTPYDSYVELIRFMVLSSGVKANVPHDVIKKPDVLDELCKSLLRAETNKRMPQVAMCNKPLQKKDKKMISDIFSKCWTYIKQQIILGGVETQIFMKFTSTLCVLTTSNLRSLRLLSTIGCLQLITDTAKQLSQIRNKTELLVSADKASQHSHVAKLINNRDLLNSLVLQILDTVYPKRFRDIDPGIRATCLSYFGIWVHYIPSTLLTKEYLDHNKWLFFDGSPAVRLECIKALTNVYLVGKALPQISSFFSTTKKRLLEILINDVDANVRSKVAHLLALISGDDLLNESELENFLLFIFDLNNSVAKEIGSVFVNNWKDNYLSRMYSNNRELLPNMSSAQKSNVELLSYCDYIVKISKLKVKVDEKDSGKKSRDVLTGIENVSKEKEKDVKDYLIWFRHTCTIQQEVYPTFSQIDTIVSTTRKFLPVLDVWIVADLIDLYITTERKSSNRVSRKVTFSAVQATENQEICLIYIFYSLCNILINEKVQGHRKDGVALEYRVLTLAPKILSKYAYEDGTQASKVCEELIVVVKNLCFENLSAVEADTTYTPLIGCVSELFQKTRNNDLIKAIVNLFERLMAAISAQDSNLIGYIFSNAKIHQGAPANYTTAKVTSSTREVFDSLMANFIKRLHSLINSLNDTSPPASMGVLSDLHFTIFKTCKLLGVSRWSPIGSYITEVGDLNITENTGILFNTISSILDRILVVPPNYVFDEESSYIVTSTAVYCLELLGLDSMWELWDSLADVVRKCSVKKKEIKEKETTGLKDRLIFLRSCLTSVELSQLPEKFIQKSHKLVKITEAIVIGAECNVPLDLPFRILSLGILSNILMLMNGDSSLLFSNISYLPPPDVQEKSKFLVTRMLNSLAFSRLEWYRNVFTKKTAQSKSTINERAFVNFYIAGAKHSMLKCIADMDRLISYDIFDVHISDIILGYYGVATAQLASYKGYCISIVSPFGAVWDGLAEHCASKIFGNRFGALVVALIKGGAIDKHNSKAFLKVKEFLQKSFSVLLSSFKISFDIYTKGVVVSDVTTVKLSRLICKSIYSWSSVVATKPEMKLLRDLVYEELCNFVRLGLSLMINLTKEYIQSDIKNEYALQLSEFNKGWKVWATVLNATSQVEKVFFDSSNLKETTENKTPTHTPPLDGLCIVDWLNEKLTAIGVSEDDIKSGEDWYYTRIIEKYNICMIRLTA